MNILLVDDDTGLRKTLRLALETLGPERVMFAADYPFENAPAAVARIDALGLDPTTLASVYHRNAERVFGLSGPA